MYLAYIMANSKYVCPLCNQPVSSSLYLKITGIWKVRENEIARIKSERIKLKKREAQFKIQKVKLIKDTAKKTAKQYEIKFKELKQREHKANLEADKKIALAIKEAHNKVQSTNKQYATKLKALNERERERKTEANKKIAMAFKEAHNKAQSTSKMQMARFEKKMKASIKRQTKTAQTQAKAEAKEKYRSIERSLKANLAGIKSESKRLHAQNAKQDAEISRLQKQLEEQTTPQIEGLVYEKKLMNELQKKFPDDKFENTGKGGDIIQNIVKNKEEIGTIVYECKKVKNYSSKHVKQTWDAQNKRKADFGILVTNAMKKDTNGFFMERGVIVVHGTAVLYVAIMLRKQIVQIAEMKLGQAEREKAIKNILNYLESPDFTNSVDSIVQDSITLYKGLMDEIKKHVKVWKERYSLYSRINSEANSIQGNTKALLSGKELEEKKTNMLPALAELPEVRDEG